VAQRAKAVPIRFQATASTIDRTTIVRFPATASEQLPSRGQVAVRGTINGRPFQTVVEPDGNFGHWIKLDRHLQRLAGVSAGQTVALDIEPTTEWPEPTIPDDFAAALQSAPAKIQQVWHEITPMARWEWVRWINETKNPATRARRVEVSLSKMDHGKRRPCCFNLAGCTDPDVAKSGKLPGSEPIRQTSAGARVPRLGDSALQGTDDRAEVAG
jgi:hypothetical protein